MHGATLNLGITLRQYVDRSFVPVATNYLWIVGNLITLRILFLFSQKSLK